MGCNSCSQARFYQNQTTQPEAVYEQPYQAPTMGFDLGTFVFGVVVGGIVAMFLVTSTGRGILGSAGRKVQRRLNK